jgi:hypothetical protein
MSEQIAGLAFSLIVYCAGAYVFLRLQARRVRALPLAWREHPALRARYDRAAALVSIRAVLGAWRKSSLAWLGAFVVTFALLGLGDTSLGFQLIYLSVLAGVFTAANARAARVEIQRIQTNESLPATKPHAGRRAQALYWTPWLLTWIGFLGSACFLGGLLGRVIR